MDGLTKVFTFDPEHPGTPKVKNLTGVTEASPLSLEFNGRKVVSLREVATTTQFPELMRSGLKAILFDAFNDSPTTFQQWCELVPSNLPSETYLKDGTFGTLPVVGELGAYSELDLQMQAPVTVANQKNGGIFAINTMVAYC